jgi:phage tail sheath protein FI
VDEIPAGSKPIEGVSTSTAGFLGRTASGGLHQASGPISSLVDYTKEFGDGADFADGTPNFLWHATAAFFREGGKRLWVTRVNSGDACPSPDDYQRGLTALETVDDISTIAAPGVSHIATADAVVIYTGLVDRAERNRRWLAILDPPPGQDVTAVLKWRRHFSSSCAALYYPWIIVKDVQDARERIVPPSGAIAGVIARTEAERGVHKAPANQVIQSAAGLERVLSDTEQEELNPHGINCLRAFPGRGILVWGSRTLDLSGEWKYVNVRRLSIYVERSIVKGLDWTVFEPNDQLLWARVRQAIEAFLLVQWRAGALMGRQAEEAFYVRCDETTMTQNDVGAGRLVCEIGIAPVRAAEFITLRIGLNSAPP